MMKKLDEGEYENKGLKANEKTPKRTPKQPSQLKNVSWNSILKSLPYVGMRGLC